MILSFPFHSRSCSVAVSFLFRCRFVLVPLPFRSCFVPVPKAFTTKKGTGTKREQSSNGNTGQNIVIFLNNGR